MVHPFFFHILAQQPQNSDYEHIFPTENRLILNNKASVAKTRNISIITPNIKKLVSNKTKKMSKKISE